MSFSLLGRAVAAGFLTSTILLTSACSTPTPAGTSSASASRDSPSPTVSSTPTSTPSPGGASSPLSVKFGYRPASLTPEQQGVGKAYDAYWVFRTQSLGTNTVDLATADTVADVRGLAQISTYVEQQKAKGLHAAGSITTNVTAVTIEAGTSIVEDCSVNDSYDVETATGAAGAPSGAAVRVTITLVARASGWVVANIDPSSESCAVPAV